MEDLPSGSRSQTSIAPRSTETVSIETSYLQSGVQAAAGLVTLLFDLTMWPRGCRAPATSDDGRRRELRQFDINSM